MERKAWDDRASMPAGLWSIAGLIGLGLLALGGLLILLPFASPVVFSSVAVVTVGNGLIALGLGAALVVTSYRAWRQRPTWTFYGTRGWWAFILLAAVMAGLGLRLPTSVQQRPIFGVVHVVLIAAPAFFLFSLVVLAAGRRAAVTYRHLALTMSGGAAAILLAAPVELIGLLISGVAATAVTLSLPGGEAEINRLMMLLESWIEQPQMAQPKDLLTLVTSPLVLVILILTLAMITPLIEELSKVLILGVMGIWIKPEPAQAFVWGAACGIGFALLEGVSSGAMALGETTGWLGGVGIRFFTTAMHAFTSGLVGAGWALYWQRSSVKQRGWLPVGYALAVLFHGVWNLNVIFTLGSVGLAVSAPMVGGAAVVVGVAIQVGLVVISLVGLVGVPFWLKQRFSV